MHVCVALSDVVSPLDAARLALQVKQKQTGSLQVHLQRQVHVLAVAM